MYNYRILRRYSTTHSTQNSSLICNMIPGNMTIIQDNDIETISYKTSDNMKNDVQRYYLDNPASIEYSGTSRLLYNELGYRYFDEVSYDTNKRIIKSIFSDKTTVGELFKDISKFYSSELDDISLVLNDNQSEISVMYSISGIDNTAYRFDCSPTGERQYVGYVKLIRPIGTSQTIVIIEDVFDKNVIIIHGSTRKYLIGYQYDIDPEEINLLFKKQVTIIEDKSVILNTKYKNPYVFDDMDVLVFDDLDIDEKYRIIYKPEVRFIRDWDLPGEIYYQDRLKYDGMFHRDVLVRD